MPTTTFYNLSEEKKKRIVDAIQAEMERTELSNLSINKIVKQAGISRGSFYQYFEDKQDMIQYMMTGFYDRLIALTQDKLKKNKGDLFKSFEDIVYETYEYVSKQTELKKLHCHLLSDRSAQEYFFSIPCKEAVAASFCEQIQPYVDRVIKEDEISLLLDLLIDVTAHTVADMFTDDFESVFEQQMEKYHNKLMIIKKGCMS